MTEFKVKPPRFDPYKNFKFRVKWDGRYVAGVSKVSALGNASKGKPITLERGVTHDSEFERWASKQSKASRKDLILEMRNEAGQIVSVYRVLGCWAAEFQAVSDLDANANAVVIQHLKLEHNGFEREP